MILYSGAFLICLSIDLKPFTMSVTVVTIKVNYYSLVHKTTGRSKSREHF